MYYYASEFLRYAVRFQERHPHATTRDCIEGAGCPIGTPVREQIDSCLNEAYRTFPYGSDLHDLLAKAATVAYLRHLNHLALKSS